MQKFTSANTSINKNKIPAIYNMKGVEEYITCKKVVDIGGGKYDNAVTYAMEKYNSIVSVYDKYNRTEEHNEKVLSSCYHTAIVSNVLNVIDSHTERMNLIRLALRHSKIVLVTVYEGNKTGIGKQTSADSWQENRRLESYIEEIRDSFPELKVEKVGRMITIK